MCQEKKSPNYLFNLYFYNVTHAQARCFVGRNFIRAQFLFTENIGFKELPEKIRARKAVTLVEHRPLLFSYFTIHTDRKFWLKAARQNKGAHNTLVEHFTIHTDNHFFELDLGITSRKDYWNNSLYNVRINKTHVRLECSWKLNPSDLIIFSES